MTDATRRTTDAVNARQRRDAALEEARAYEAARLGNQAWMGRVAETMNRLSTDPELLASIERRGF